MREQQGTYLCEVECRRGGVSGLHKGGRNFGGLGLQGQPDVSSVRNNFEGSFTEEVMGLGKAINECGFKFAAFK